MLCTVPGDFVGNQSKQANLGTPTKFPKTKRPVSNLLNTKHPKTSGLIYKTSQLQNVSATKVSKLQNILNTKQPKPPNIPNTKFPSYKMSQATKRHKLLGKNTYIVN